MRRYHWIVVSILVALAPIVAGASVSYTWDAGLDDWGPWGSSTDCVWVSGTGRTTSGAMRAKLSCLSPQFSKSSSDQVQADFYIASDFAGLAGRVAVVLDPFSEVAYCTDQLYSSTSDDTVWDEQNFTCNHADVLAAVAFHLVIDYSGSGYVYVDDLSITGAAMPTTPTPTPAPVLATATPTIEPIIFPATPTPVPTWQPAATPTAIPSPVVPDSPTPIPGEAGDLNFPIRGSVLLPLATNFLSDWSAIIGPAAIAALSAMVLVLLGKFLGGGR